MNLAEPSWHLFAFLKRIDFVSAWKAISIVFTGGFGILGLATEFKNKHTHKITKWGWVSLVGILISTILGVMAQLKESHDDARKAVENSEIALQLAKNTQTTLGEVRRLLTPLGDPLLQLSFEVPCSDTAYKAFCLKAQRLPSEGLTDDKWPITLPDGITIMSVNIFKGRKGVAHSIEQMGSHNVWDEQGDVSFELVFVDRQLKVDRWFEASGKPQTLLC
jgi:hypothetical protein